MKYKEIHVLADMLTAAGISHSIEPFCDGYLLLYPKRVIGEEHVVDVVEYSGSLGSDKDLLQAFCADQPKDDDPQKRWGMLTAQDVFEHIMRLSKKIEED